MSQLPAPGTYTIDAVHSSVGFVARHLVASKVRGNFTDFEGTIEIQQLVIARAISGVHVK